MVLISSKSLEVHIFAELSIFHLLIKLSFFFSSSYILWPLQCRSLEVKDSVISVSNIRWQISYIYWQGFQCLHLEFRIIKQQITKKRIQIGSFLRNVLLQGRDDRCTMAGSASREARQAVLLNREITQFRPSWRKPFPGSKVLHRRHEGLRDVAGGQALFCEACERPPVGWLSLRDIGCLEHGHRDGEPRWSHPVFSQLWPACDIVNFLPKML